MFNNLNYYIAINIVSSKKLSQDVVDMVIYIRA